MCGGEEGREEQGEPCPRTRPHKYKNKCSVTAKNHVENKRSIGLHLFRAKRAILFIASGLPLVYVCLTWCIVILQDIVELARNGCGSDKRRTQVRQVSE